MVDAAATPDIQSKAAAHIDAIVDTALGRDAQVSVNRGATIRNWKEGASEDVVEIVVKDAKFKNAPAKVIEAEAKKVTDAMHEERDIRRQAVLLSPKDYLEYGKKEIKELQTLAKVSGTPMANVDFSTASILNADFSQSQKPAHGTQVVDGPDVTRIRINIPTNPEKLEEAETLAKKVEADLKGGLPQMQTGMIEYIKRKKAIPNLTPEIEEQLKKHEFKVITQQQENWTSVFIEIRSPEQVHAREHPEEKNDPEALKATNMLMKIDDADRRAKVAARAALFTGEKLCTPASYFMDVAGVDDVKNGLKKMLKHAVEKNPELKQRADDLLNENFLIAPEWNVPTEQQTLRKQPVSVAVKPGTDELKITLRMKEGDGDKMLAALAAKPATPAVDTLAAAANVTACAPGEIAVSGSGAAVGADGKAVAGAGGACVNPETKEVAAAGSAVALDPVVEQAGALAAVVESTAKPAAKPALKLGDQTITSGDITSFLKKVQGSHADKALASQTVPRQLGA